MNRQFANYVTGTAFQLLLTKAQVRALIGISAPKGSMQEMLSLYVWKSITSLLHKGLISWEGKEYVLTEAGKLTVKLLDEAGLIPTRSKAKALPDKFVKSLDEELKTAGAPERKRGGTPGGGGLRGRNKVVAAFDKETLGQ